MSGQLAQLDAQVKLFNLTSLSTEINGTFLDIGDFQLQDIFNGMSKFVGAIHSWLAGLWEAMGMLPTIAAVIAIVLVVIVLSVASAKIFFFCLIRKNAVKLVKSKFL